MPTRAAAKSSSTARIRRARPVDRAALAALEIATFDYDRMSARQIAHHVGNRHAIMLVAERGGELLGSALVFLREGSRVARLYSIAIAESARGHGDGARLLAAAERAAVAAGASVMRLEVRADNAGAQALYEKRGYRRIGLRSAYYDDGHDAVRYEKTL